MKIQISVTYIFYLAIITILGLLKWYLLFLFCIIIHELGHVLIGYMYGVKIRNIKVNVCGIGIVYENNILTGKNKVFMLMAGPAANIITGIICMKAPYMLICNLVMCCFNLLPIYPLDGAQILEEMFFPLIKQIETIAIILLTISICIISINYSNILLLVWGIYVISFCINAQENKNKC